MVLNHDECFLLVVLGNHLPVERNDSESENARTRLRRLERNAHRRHLALTRKLDPLYVDDPTVVFHNQIDARSRVAGLRHGNVHHQRCTLKHRSRRFHAAHFDITGELLLPQANRVDRHRSGPQRQERLLQRLVCVVGAIGQQDETRQRHRRQLLASPAERSSEIRLVPRKLQGGYVVDPLRTRRKTEETQDEPVGQSPQHSAVLHTEMLLNPARPRCTVHICQSHAAGIVDQNPKKVFLRDNGRQHQHGPEQ